jgi:prolyl 4-hydroxylase
MHKESVGGEDAFVVHGFLSGEECDRLIARSEAIGYEAATVGEALAVEMRNNARVILDDPGLAAELWARARPLMPQVGGREAVGLNPRIRFYRYDVGEAFAPHYDGSYSPGDGTESRLTFMVYLNDGCEGGGTNFYAPGGTVRLEVRSERGKAMIFAHLLLHEGAAVTGGRKYALRTDVMYRRPDPDDVRRPAKE